LASTQRHTRYSPHWWQINAEFCPPARQEAQLSPVKLPGAQTLTAWCTALSGCGHRAQRGLIAGGLADGTIGVWSADKVLDASEDAEDVPDALLTTLSGHSGPVSLHCGHCLSVCG
jgi:hypothetical protein